MTSRRLRLALLLILGTVMACALLGQSTAQRPYVVLVSLDGFRYDYAERDHATNLLAIAKAGASTPEGMIPSFPSVTFPNHISIVTGLYPEHHGIVENSFWDPARKQRYSMNQSAVDGSWYRAKPLWVVAEEQKVKSACMFWPTSDAEILGVRPSYWKLYDGRFPNEQRVAQVIDWLKLPEEQRPHFITLYFSDVDSAGHSSGPDSPQVTQAVLRVDKLVGDLRAGIQATALPVDLIVLADHGMQTVEGFVNVGEFADFSKLQVINAGPLMLLYAPDAETAEKTYLALKGKSPKFEVYRRKETPARWHYADDPRIGDLVIIAKGPNTLVTAAPAEGRRTGRGTHGFDPGEFQTMNAIFYAEGPNVKPGVQLKPFENVNVFPFVTKILGLKNPAGLDGSEKVLADAYRPN